MVKIFAQLHQIVEIMWKYPCNTPCNSRVKFCVYPTTAAPTRAKLTFPTHFSRFSHPFSHNRSAPVFQPTFPLFHNPYYYNYLIYK